VRIKCLTCFAMLALTFACSVHQGHQAGISPKLSNDNFPPRNLIKKVTLVEATATLEKHLKHADAVSLSAQYRKGDSIWFYCFDDLTLDASFSPERGFVLVRANSIVKSITIYPAVPVSSLSLRECSNYPYSPQ
jgi:hypothetical protein